MRSILLRLGSRRLCHASNMVAYAVQIGEPTIAMNYTGGWTTLPAGAIVEISIELPVRVSSKPIGTGLPSAFLPKTFECVGRSSELRTASSSRFASHSCGDIVFNPRRGLGRTGSSMLFRTATALLRQPVRPAPLQGKRYLESSNRTARCPRGSMIPTSSLMGTCSESTKTRDRVKKQAGWNTFYSCADWTSSSRS